MPNYAQIPDFGQLVEYITQAEPAIVDGETLYGLVFNRMPMTSFFGGDEQDEANTIHHILSDYIHVFKIINRALNLDGIDLDNVIPLRIRTKINAWLSNHGYPTVPAGWTYKQMLLAIKARV
jgi:hypothetical protein